MIKQRRRSNVLARMDSSRRHGFADLVTGYTYRQPLADVGHRRAVSRLPSGKAAPLAVTIPFAEALAQVYR